MDFYRQQILPLDQIDRIEREDNKRPLGLVGYPGGGEAIVPRSSISMPPA